MDNVLSSPSPKETHNHCFKCLPHFTVIYKLQDELKHTSICSLISQWLVTRGTLTWSATLKIALLVIRLTWQTHDQKGKYFYMTFQVFQLFSHILQSLFIWGYLITSFSTNSIFVITITWRNTMDHWFRCHPPFTVVYKCSIRTSWNTHNQMFSI